MLNFGHTCFEQCPIVSSIVEPRSVTSEYHKKLPDPPQEVKEHTHYLRYSKLAQITDVVTYM